MPFSLNGWGMMHLQLQLHELDASIVIANGQIDYAKPVAEEIVVSCSFCRPRGGNGYSAKVAADAFNSLAKCISVTARALEVSPAFTRCALTDDVVQPPLEHERQQPRCGQSDIGRIASNQSNAG